MRSCVWACSGQWFGSDWLAKALGGMLQLLALEDINQSVRQECKARAHSVSVHRHAVATHHLHNLTTLP